MQNFKSACISLGYPDAYSEYTQTFKMNRFAKIFLAGFLTKRSNLDVWWGYAITFFIFNVF